MSKPIVMKNVEIITNTKNEYYTIKVKDSNGNEAFSNLSVDIKNKTFTVSTTYKPLKDRAFNKAKKKAEKAARKFGKTLIK